MNKNDHYHYYSSWGCWTGLETLHQLLVLTMLGQLAADGDDGGLTTAPLQLLSKVYTVRETLARPARLTLYRIFYSSLSGDF